MATPLSRPDLDASIVAAIYQNAQRRITGTVMQAQMLKVTASMVNTITDRDTFNGFLGIDETGLVDTSFIRLATPVGKFLRDDGTFATVSVSLGTGSAGYIAKWASGSALANSFIFEGSNDIQILSGAVTFGIQSAVTEFNNNAVQNVGSLLMGGAISHASNLPLSAPIIGMNAPEIVLQHAASMRSDTGTGTHWDFGAGSNEFNLNTKSNNTGAGISLTETSATFGAPNGYALFNSTTSRIGHGAELNIWAPLFQWSADSGANLQSYITGNTTQIIFKNPTGKIFMDTYSVGIQNNTSVYVEIANTIMMNVAPTANSWFDWDANGLVQIGTTSALINVLEVPGVGGNVTISGAFLSMGDGAGNYLQMDFLSNAGTISDDLWGVGFVYAADYSAGFVNESLISKRYADTKLSLSGGTMTGNILVTSSHGVDTTSTGGTDVLNFGTSNADVINVGRAGITINILGAIVNENVTNSYVTDKLITLNSGGGAGTGIGVGFEIQENSLIVGYLKTNSARNSFEILVPAVAYKSTLSLGNLTADHTHKLPNYDGELISDGGSYSDPSWLTSLAWGKITFSVQNANYIFAGPASGSAATPTFRALVAGDIPSLSSIYQPLDSDLTTIAGLTATTDNFIVSVSSAWASRTPAQVRTTLGLVIGTNVQAYLGYTPVNVAGDTMGGYLTLNADPTSALHAVTKQYVDNSLATQDSKPQVAYASTSALPAYTYNNGSSGVGSTWTGTANGPLIIDGVTILGAQVGERVLIAGESSAEYNGWATITQVGVIGVSPYILTRATESDTAAEIGAGYLTSVIAPNGVVAGSNNGKVFISIANDPFVVGTTLLTFSAVGGVYYAGSGLTLTGSTFSIAASAITNSMLAGSIDLTAKVTGVLPLANGGSGTATAFTIGSVLFATTSGVYSQDNNNFYWNAASHILSVDCAGDTGGTDAINVYKQIDSFSINNSDNGFSISNARGSVGSFTENLANDYIGLIGFYPYNGSAWTEYASIRSYVKGATSTNRGADLEFYTKANGGSVTLALTIDNTQNVIFANPLSLSGSNFTGVLPTANGGMDASFYRWINHGQFSFIATQTANTYFMVTGGVNGATTATSGNAVVNSPAMIYIAASELPTINGSAPKLRIRANLLVNHVAPTGNFTFGLYPMTPPASSGGAGLRSHTIGTVISGSNGAAFTTPAADTNNTAVSADFAVPEDGFYCICIVTTATVATSSFVECYAELQVHNP